jgi:acyl-coenzyme A synthetase/AMP-(fatty) acid ligase
VLGWFDRAERSIRPAKPLMAGPRTLTYGALIDRTRRLSTLFRELGLLRDDRAVIATDDDIAAITIFLALLRSGITAVVLDPQASRPELETLIQAADAKALFVDDRVIARGGVQASKRADAALVPIGDDAAQPSLLGRLTRGLRAGRRAPGELAYPAVLDAMAPTRDLPADVPEAALAYILFTLGHDLAAQGCRDHASQPRGADADLRPAVWDWTTRPGCSTCCRCITPTALPRV